MELIHYKVCGDQIKSMPNNVLILFAQLAHLIDCVSIFHKLLIYTSHKSDEEVHEHANVTQKLIIARILGGIIVEGWNVLKNSYFNSKLSNTYDSRLSDTGKEVLDKLKKYFAQENLLTESRNKFSFHFDRNVIEEYLPSIEGDNEYHIYLAESQGNSLFYLAEEICNMAWINTCKEISGTSHMVDAHKKFYSDLLNISQYFYRFTHEILAFIVFDYLDKNGEFPAQKIHLDNLDSINDTKIPFFVIKENEKNT